MANSNILIEDTDHEYEISSDDIHIYAQQIGIDINKESHLMWIAKEGLSSKVPEPWLICSDEKDRVFYYNPETSKTSWHHPLDKHYAALVSEERTKSKSLNSASSDYGFESKLSSLADAPPLSSSGKNSPLPFKSGKKDGGLAPKGLEFGRIENRRGTQLAPVRLNALKMPTAPVPKSSGGMSFMPKGSSFTKNVRRLKDEKDPISQHEEGLDYEHPLDDSNESINSDDGSKYSYEETDDEKQLHVHEPYDMLDASQLSPMHSADESPDAQDINSVMQLGTKVPPRLDSNLKRDNFESICNKENSPSLSLRKVGQPTFLKPLTQTTKKKGSNKSTKATKKVKNKNLAEIEMSIDEKISSYNDEQQIMLDQIQKEWLAMQDDLEKKEKEKYEEMIKDSTKRLEEEEIKLRKENSNRIAQIKSDLQKKIEEEEHAAEMRIQSLRETNKQRISEEEKKLLEELEMLSEKLRSEIKNMEEKNALELAQRKKEIEEASSKELDDLKGLLETNKKNIEEAHANEILIIQQAQEQRIKEIKSEHEKEQHEAISSVSQKESVNEEIQKLQKLIKDETKQLQDLMKEKEVILKEISAEKSSLEELKNETSKAQSTIEELQDEIEKTENELDLLRSEKSGLISELNIIKENISNQKSNLSNLEKKLNASFDNANCSKKFSEAEINTDLSFNDFICKAVQVSVSCCDVSSQIENVSYPMSDAMCQTSIIPETANKSCQFTAVPSAEDKNVQKISSDRTHLDSRTVLDKTLQNALSGLGVKLDSRINVIEDQLRLLQESLSRPQQPIDSSQEFIQTQFSKANAESRTIPPTFYTNNSLPFGQFSDNIPVASQNKCKCELGDPASCSILQDVKNSVYQLNDILCANFVPPIRSNTVYPVSQPVNYSSPFNNFYAQLRQLQEKQRSVDLKHKCEDSALTFTKDTSFNSKDAKNFGRLNDTKSSYHLSHPGMYSHNASEDPMIRARSIVLREKAREWKEQQALQSSVSHMFSMNSTSASSQSSANGFTSPYYVPSSDQTFFNFEIDPEANFNMWMTRLNALQLRIRSHQIL